MLCVSCKKTTGTLSSTSDRPVSDDTKSNAAALKALEMKYKQFFLQHYSADDIGIIADVTEDDTAELIAVEQSDQEIRGKVFTLIEDEITCIEEKIGGHDHASNFFNWYLWEEENDRYRLVEENNGMWQGVGTCETIVYQLTLEGERKVEKQLSVSSKGNTPVDDDDFAEYRKAISDVIGNSYEILHTSTESSKKPKNMDADLLINASDETDTTDSANSSQSASTSSKEDASHIVLKLGKYKSPPDFEDLYAFITLEPDNKFTIEANFELNSFQKVSPFTRKGTYQYKVEKPSDDPASGGFSTWVELYLNNEFYWVYAVVDEQTFQDQAIVFTLSQ